MFRLTKTCPVLVKALEDLCKPKSKHHGTKDSPETHQGQAYQASPA